MPETPRGNKYIITLTDRFSKWAEAAALPDKTTEGIARFIYSMVSLNKVQVTELSTGMYIITFLSIYSNTTMQCNVYTIMQSI